MAFIFLHIPKTGGTTLLNILVRHWNMEEIVVNASVEKLLKFKEK